MKNSVNSNDPNWWDHSTIYQVYLRSIGTYRTLTRNLQYFVDLGVDVLWINPTFPHGNKDGGYDIMDYYGIAEEFGTLEDFQQFLQQAHHHGLRVILDLVCNHTSSEHPWFRESASGTGKKDWYCWQPDTFDPTQSNWISEFVESPWTYSEERQQYYYHFFYPQQPDLNYRCPEVVEEMFRIFNYWLEMGVDGFRLDAVSHLMETEGNNPVTDNDTVAYSHQINSDDNYEFWESVRTWMDTHHPNKILLGETNCTHTTPEQVERYQKIFHLVMDFNFIKYLDKTIAGKDVDTIMNLTPDDLPKGLGGGKCYFVNNHDMFRQRYGESEVLIAMVVSRLLLSIPGAVIIYYGEEFGKPNEPTELSYPENRIAARGAMDFDNMESKKNELWEWYQFWIRQRKN